MVESVAVLADIHGVLPVLDAVLAEPEVRDAELIVVCGDHAAGPQPVETLDRLMELGNVVLVRGNADRELVVLARGKNQPLVSRMRLTSGRPVSWPRRRWSCWRACPTR